MCYWGGNRETSHRSKGIKECGVSQQFVMMMWLCQTVTLTFFPSQVNDPPPRGVLRGLMQLQCLSAKSVCACLCQCVSSVHLPSHLTLSTDEAEFNAME